MKNLFSYLPKKALFILISFIAVVGIAVGAKAGFGPDRPVYTMAKPADHVTFNSITDNPVVGDERQFVTGAINGVSSTDTDPVNNVKDGDEVNIVIFVHNNAEDSLNLKATNTKVRVALPTGTNKTQVVTGYISADNAAPKEVFDTVDINGANNTPFELSYVSGTAMFKNNFFTNGTKIDDSVVTTGALLGYDKLDGVIPGCTQYSGWVQLRVKVKMAHYNVEKLARIAGEGSDKWRETVTAKSTDTVEWLIKFNNLGSTTLENVEILDEVPGNLTVVPGSVKLMNRGYPTSNPYVFPAEAIRSNGKQIYVGIGDYEPTFNAFVMFSTKVTDASKIVCGDNKFTNLAYATPTGYGAVSDQAYLVINKDCGQATYRCDNLSVATTGTKTVEAKVSTTANNGATLKTITYNFGDGSQALVSTNTTVSHTYSGNGPFTIKAVPSFMVDGKLVDSPSDNCVKQASFELPNTGANGLAVLFIGTAIVSGLGYRLWLLKRQTR
jgi:uncharacterized repeat protein (TIGR01451 family)